MKHLLNNISEEEKNSILEQHGGGMKIFNENFHKMVNKKLGHVDLYEQTDTTKDSSTENTRKLSDIDSNIFRSENDVARAARGLHETYGLQLLELFRYLSSNLYDKNAKNSPVTNLYMKGNGGRFESLVKDYVIKISDSAKETFPDKKQNTSNNMTYADLKKYMGKDDDHFANLYDSWLKSKLS